MVNEIPILRLDRSQSEVPLVFTITHSGRRFLFDGSFKGDADPRRYKIYAIHMGAKVDIRNQNPVTGIPRNFVQFGEKYISVHRHILDYIPKPKFQAVTPPRRGQRIYDPAKRQMFTKVTGKKHTCIGKSTIKEAA